MVKKSETEEEERYTISFFKEGGRALHTLNRGCDRLALLGKILGKVSCFKFNEIKVPHLLYSP